MPLLPGLFGRLLLATLRPGSGRRVQARPAFRPSTSEIAPGIVVSFLEQHDRLLRLMEASGRLDLDRIVVTSPVSRLVTYSLMDAYRSSWCTSRACPFRLAIPGAHGGDRGR